MNEAGKIAWSHLIRTKTEQFGVSGRWIPTLRTSSPQERLQICSLYFSDRILVPKRENDRIVVLLKINWRVNQLYDTGSYHCNCRGSTLAAFHMGDLQIIWKQVRREGGRVGGKEGEVMLLCPFWFDIAALHKAVNVLLLKCSEHLGGVYDLWFSGTFYIQLQYYIFIKLYKTKKVISTTLKVLQCVQGPQIQM